MSHVDNGPLPTYNSLVDTHLAGFFANVRLRRQLRKAGLITRNGEIVSENMYRLNMSRKEHKKHVKDMLAQAIVHKTLDIERVRQAEIRNKLEQISKIQLVRKVRASRSRHKDEDLLPYLDTSRAVSAPAKKGKYSLSGLSSSYEDDETVVYLDDEGSPISPSHMDTSGSRYSSRESSNSKRPTPKDQTNVKNLSSMDTAALRNYVRLMAKTQNSHTGYCSPYLVPQVPLPPTSPRRSVNARSASRYKQPSARISKSSSPKRPFTAVHTNESAKIYRGQQETCEVTMQYHGPGINLAQEYSDPKHEILVEQQHCGGNTLIVFKDKLLPNSSFSFVSHRHRDYPFALSIYVESKMVCRVSVCCEHSHKQGGRIGGKTGHFSIKKITGAVPCYKCRVKRGLKVNYPVSQQKTKQPQTSHEEVTVSDSPERKVLGTGKKKIKGKSSQPEKQVLVPVDNIDTHKDGDKYEDDFESSSKSSTSSSDSDEGGNTFC